jgi:adenylate cyclase, class 2
VEEISVGIHSRRILAAMQAAEIELKFSVTDIRALRSAADGVGFRLVTERTFESNTLYDTADRELRGRRQILRLRNYGERCTVTHKRQADGADGDSRYKTRIETESEVEDCAALSEIFSQLGYGPVFRYEKFRTELEMDEGKLVLDETPIGVWAELEGPPAWIDTMLERLGVAPELRSTESYGKLFLRWKDETHSSAENLTFDEIAAAKDAGTLVEAAAR